MEKVNQSYDFTLILSTCNEYECLWSGFFDCIKKNWKSFDAPIISTATVQPKTCFNVETTKSKDQSFSSRLIEALKKCKTEIVLLMLDDFYITKEVDISFFNHALIQMKRNKKIKCINLHEEKDEIVVFKRGYDNLFIVKNNRYKWSATTQASLWDKKYLLKLLHRGESAWDFEINGSVRNKYYNPLILYRKDSFSNAFYYPYGGIVESGKWRVGLEYDPIIKRYRLKDKKINIKLCSDNVKYHSIKKRTIGKIYRKIYRIISPLIPSLRYYGNEKFFK